MLKYLCAALLLPCFLLQSFCNAQLYNLNVQVVLVYDDAGANPTNLGPAGGADESYLYQPEVNAIWEQADVQVTFLPTISWNNTAAQRLSSAELSALFANTFPAGTGDAVPGIASDAVQVFFVMDHPGTGFNPNNPNTTGYVGNPLTNPNFSARNAGIAQLGIAGVFSSNGRAVMANEGFAAPSLGATLAHEIGHLLGLRHTETIPGSATGSTADPSFILSLSTPNLMWGGGSGGADGTTLTAEQISASIVNGLALDPDGNGIGVLQEIPVTLGDVNRDGIVNFLDISPFIGVLSAGEFQEEADIDVNFAVNFLDIAPFIAILSGQ